MAALECSRERRPVVEAGAAGAGAPAGLLRVRALGRVLAPADFLSKFSWSGWPVARLKFLKFSQS